jgi:anti-sigma B factor antagonist
MSTSGPGFKVVRYGPNTYFLGGELDMATAPLLEEAVAPSVENGGGVLLDLASVTFIDSVAVNTILRIARELGDEGCIFLHSPQRAVLRVLTLLGIGEVPNIHLEACPSDGYPNGFLDWRTPEDIGEQFAALRALGAT